MARAVEFPSKEAHLEWLRTWRGHNAAMLAEYEPGTKRAFNNNVDVTDERKAHLRRTIQEIDGMIEELERNA